MKLSIDTEELRPLVAAVVAEVVAQMGSLPGAAERLAYTEPEAATLLGLRAHQLRDARLRGEVISTRAGGRIAYTRESLVQYLARGCVEK